MDSKKQSVWKDRCVTEWNLGGKGIPLPQEWDWESTYQKKPFGRNLIKNPCPEGLSHKVPLDTTRPQAPPPRKPLESLGDFSGWKTKEEHLPVDTSGIPEGAVICHLPNYSWVIKEQIINLKEEGFWEELLDVYQPDICVTDWYEDSQLHDYVYELHVKLLGIDHAKVINEFSLKPKNERSETQHKWCEVSHIFQKYGPGVRYIHFEHRTKDLFVVGFDRTRVTDSTVRVQLRE